jgi:predicted acylesterase/phospholipase RssA
VTIHVALGGGGWRAPVHGGFLSRLRELGVEVTGIDGVSAGALATAYAAQGDYDRMRDLSLTAMIPDGHRLKTGPELIEEAGRVRIRLWPPRVDVTIAVNRIQSVGRNDRLWTNYLERDIDPTRVQVPCWVGCTVWCGPDLRYLSIPHTAGQWARAVWGSATMPLIWESIEWTGTAPDSGEIETLQLVDGGLMSVIPLDDAMFHIMHGHAPKPDLVVALGTTPGNPFLDEPAGLVHGALRTLGTMTAQTTRDDVEPKSWWPSDQAYEVRYIEPDLGGTLDATPELQLARWNQGVAIADELFG